MATLLVTGVSGVLGSRLLPLLAADPTVERVIGIDVRPLTTSAPKLQFIQGDLSSSDLTTVLRGVDVVVHLAAPTDPGALPKLLDACDANGVRHVVAMSSAVVFGAWPSNPVPLPEDAPLRPNPEFAAAVALAEQERRLTEWRSLHGGDGADVGGARVAILRFAMVLGGGSERTLAIALGGVEAHRGEHTSRPVQFLHIDDAVRALAFAIERQLDGTYNVAPAGFVGDAMARAVAGAAPRPALPRRWAELANQMMWRHRFRSDFSGAQAYLEHPWVIASDRLRAEGWESSYSSEEALVAEARPTWWGGLRPGQRRTLVSGGIVVGTVGGWLLSSLGTVALAHRLRRRRSSR